MTSGRHVPDGGSAYTRPPVDKDLLGFLVVAADTGHRNRDSLFVPMLASGEPCWPLGPALCPFVFTQPLTRSPGQWGNARCLGVDRRKRVTAVRSGDVSLSH